MSSANLAQIKTKIQQSVTLSPAEKREWLSLLPKMTEGQIQELDRILSVRVSAKPALPPPPQKAPPVPAPPSRTLAVPDARAKTAPAPETPAGLAALSVRQLRAAPSVYDFLEKLGQQIRDIRARGTSSAADIESALAASPLYDAYVQAGLRYMAGASEAALTREEFEAITDFRTKLRQILA